MQKASSDRLINKSVLNSIKEDVSLSKSVKSSISKKEASTPKQMQNHQSHENKSNKAKNFIAPLPSKKSTSTQLKKETLNFHRSTHLTKSLVGVPIKKDDSECLKASNVSEPYYLIELTKEIDSKKNSNNN